MSILLEHDYIGLTELSSMESSEKTEEEDDNTSNNNNNNNNNNNVLNLKRTELRLGLPGSESPERREEMGLSLSLKGVEDSSNGLCLNSFVSGAKRGFSDAIDASGKWGFSGNGGSQVDWPQGGGVVFSPRAGNGGSRILLQGGAGAGAGAGLAANGTKDVRPPTTPNSLQPKKPDVAAASSDQSPPSKAQVVGWPPIRSFRKNTMTPVNSAAKESEDKDAKSGSGCLYVKVSMDGAPYLRKVDLKTYSNYRELSASLEKMFSCFTIGQCGSHGVQGRNGQSESRLMDVLRGSECVLTFEDKDGDWMLVGDVPWDMFIDSCKRLRIMKGSEAIGLAPKVMEKSKNWS